MFGGSDFHQSPRCRLEAEVEAEVEAEQVDAGKAVQRMFRRQTIWIRS